MMQESSPSTGLGTSMYVLLDTLCHGADAVLSMQDA